MNTGYASEAAETDKKKPTDKTQDTHTWLKQCFETAEHMTEPARARSEKARDYYDTKQFTSKELKTLERRGQPATQRNMIQPKIDYIVGLEIKKRSDPKAYPRTPKHEQDADGATQALRYAADKANLKRTKTCVTKEFLIEGGPTGAYVGVKKTPRGEIEVVVNHLPWDRCFADPHSRELDYSDAAYKGFITWMDASEAKRQFPEAEKVVEETVSHALSNSSTYDDRPKYQKWVDTKRKRIRVIEIYYDGGDGVLMCAALTEAGFLKEPVKVEFVDQDGEPDDPLVFTSAYCDRENNRYGQAWTLIDRQDSINKRWSKATHLLNVRQAWVGPSVADADKVRRELAKPDGVIQTEREDFEILPTNDLAAGQFQLLQLDLTEMQGAGPNAALLGKGPDAASGRAILANQQGGQTELEPQMDELAHWELTIYRKIWNRIRQYWTGEMWIRVTDDERNIRWVGINAPITNAEMAQRQGMPPEQLQQMGLDPNAPATDPQTGQPMLQNPVGELDVDIILDRGPDTVTLQQEQFETLAQVPGIPPDILIELSHLPNKDKVMDRLTGKVGPGGSPPQEPPPPPEVIKAKADAEDKDKQRQFEAAKAVGDREIEREKIGTEREKINAQREKDQIAASIEMEKLRLEREKIELERARVALEAAKIEQAARDAAASREWDERKTTADFAMRASEQAEQRKQKQQDKTAKPEKEAAPKSDGSSEGMKAMGEGLKAVAAALSKPKNIKRDPSGRALGIE